MKRLPIGTIVRSVAVGIKPEFVGSISGYAPEGCYHVRDKDGNGWHRQWREITVLTNPDSNHPPP